MYDPTRRTSGNHCLHAFIDTSSRVGRPIRGCWNLVFRNRFAIAVASLVWLVWRSGTQPRRLAYPCQQAAAANLGFLAVLFIPEAARRHARRYGKQYGTMRRAVGLATGSVALAGALFILVSQGAHLYSDIFPPSAPDIDPPAVMPPAATVGIVKTTKAINTLTDLDVEAMVRSAVAKAGGLGGIISPNQSVAIKPNLVNDNAWTETAPSGVTTDPRVVAAVVKMAKEAGASSVKIIEGCAGPAVWGSAEKDYRDITKYAFYYAGYSNSLGGTTFKYDSTVALVDINDAGTGDTITDYGSLNPASPPANTVYVDLGNNGMVRHGYYIHKACLKPSQGGTSDVLITVPTMKNHGNAGMTAALKSHVGIAPSDIYHAPDSPLYETWRDHWRQMKIAGVHISDPNSPFPRATDFPSDGLHPNPGTDENTNVHYSIVDLNLVRPNDFAVVDGLVGVTNGPCGDTGGVDLIGGGDWSAMSAIILAGKDSVAVDSVVALCEGYDPLYSLQIGWSWNRELGNRNTTEVTVVGDHVDAVRKNYPDGYGGSSRVEQVRPPLTGMTPLDNSEVYGNVVVTGSGITSDAAKAELSVKLTGGTPNLLVNGDFEQGSTGWTNWASSWSSSSTLTRDFNDTTSGSGKCLHMTCTPNGSFGVYQVVDVIPGRTYKIDAYWKGLKLGTNGADNWYEILLLDGDYDYNKIDGNANSFPYTDPSEPVFNEMYGYDSHTYTMTSDFGWEWAHTKNGTPVDTIWRNGVRQATGSKMTVAVKVGALPGGTASSGSGWFDNISLTECVEETIVDQVVAPTVPSFNTMWASSNFPNGNYDVKLTVYDQALNETSITRHLVLGISPGEADFTADVQTGTAPLTVQFTDQSSVSGASAWSWNFGDGQTSTLQHPAHTYTNAGTYTVSLTVTGSLGPVSVQKPNFITANPASADFTADVQAGPAPLTVHFTDQSTAPGASAWHWYFGDGQTSDEHNPTHTYTLEGVFTVQLTVTTGVGPLTATKPAYVTVASIPKVAFIGGPINSVWPNASDAQIIQRLRDMGLIVDVYRDDRALRPAAAEIAAGHQLVIGSSTLTSGNVAGDFRNQPVPFIFWEPALAWHANPDNRECMAGTSGSNTSASQTQIKVTNNSHPVMAGVPSGNVTVLNSSETFSYFRPSSSLAPGVQSLATLTGDTNSHVVLVAEAGAQLLDGQPAAARRVMLYLYDNTWEKTNATGRKIFDNAVIWALGSPQAMFSADWTTGSAPMTARFTDASTGPVVSWAWNFGDGTTSGLRHPTHRYTQPGTYTVSLTVGGPGSQSNTLTRTAYVTVGPASPADYNVDGHVDLADLELFDACAAGAAVVVDIDCAGKDLDHDLDVDQDDFAVFQRCWSGTDMPAQSVCP